MTSRLITTSLALASAIVLANGLAGCDYVHRTFGIGDSSSGESGSAASPAGTSQGSPMYPNGYQQSQNAPAASATEPGAGTGAPSSASTMSSNMGSAPATAATTPDEIKQAQQALADQGLYKGRIDGVVGRQTRRAVRQFQKGHGLSQTARLDADTMQALNGGQVTNSGAGK